ncbi:MAG: FAD-binding oxidoreductase, partial [Magnetospirillum sp.]|nr:FAD-binding oxidoreductase [Magnetospirillum sp.]
RLNRFVEFDAETGRLVAEAGVTFNDLLDVFLPLGWMAPVTPGTAFVTLGGALANDVHGKNHDGDGSFGQHVEWFDLLTASGESLRVSPASHPDLFRATLGGMGLTGIVTALCLTLRKVPSATFAVTEERAPDLDGLMDLLAGARQTASHSVAWIDALARGKSLGRGVVETGRISPDQAKSPSQRRSLALPMDLPSLAMSAPLVAAFNHAYYHRIPEGGRRRLADSRSFLYPLDAISGWNRLYGKRGFHQFQCVIPEAAAPQAMRLLLETIAAARAASFLAVLKTLGEEGAGFLSFPMRGWSLALDFPARSGVVDLLARLEAITIDHGGRIYLAKDSVMAPASLDRMYPRLERLRRVLAQIDPHGHWQSDMARRLMIRGAA